MKTALTAKRTEGSIRNFSLDSTGGHLVLFVALVLLAVLVAAVWNRNGASLPQSETTRVVHRAADRQNTISTFWERMSR